MQELSKESISYLTKLIRTINSARIGSAVIDDLGARAIDETGTVALMGTKIPEFPGSIGLTRVPQLKARLDLVSGKDSFKVEYLLNEEKGYIKSLKFIANGIKADYRTGDPENIRAPKRILDEEVTSFPLTSPMVSDIQSAVVAFGPAKDIQFAIADKRINLIVHDETADVFSTFLGTTEYSESRAHTYDALNVSNLLKQALNDNTVTVGIGQKGILSIQKEPFTFYVMPSKRG